MSEVDSVREPPSNETASMEATLLPLRRGRARYSADQVNFIREAYYLDDRSLPWIQERLHPQCSLSMLWRIARGRARQDVPLSPRLQAAVDADRKPGL